MTGCDHSYSRETTVDGKWYVTCECGAAGAAGRLPMVHTAAQRHRLSEMERLARWGALPLGSPCELKVVGVSFVPTYPENLYMLQAEYEEAVASVGHQVLEMEALPVILVRNPDNPHDANAVQVHVPALGDWAFIGHLTSPIAARIAPELDAGVHWRAGVVSVLIDDRHPDRPGISIRLERITE